MACAPCEKEGAGCFVTGAATCIVVAFGGNSGTWDDDPDGGSTRGSCMESCSVGNREETSTARVMLPRSAPVGGASRALSGVGKDCASHCKHSYCDSAMRKLASSREAVSPLVEAEETEEEELTGDGHFRSCNELCKESISTDEAVRWLEDGVVPVTIQRANLLRGSFDVVSCSAANDVWVHVADEGSPLDFA